MKPNPLAEQKYARHVKHLDRDAIYLGEAENLDEITRVVEEIKPNVYMLAKSCVDRTPTLQLANWQIVRRMSLGSLSSEDKSKLVDLLASKGIQYKKTRYLALNPDFTETEECRHQERFGRIYSAYYETKVFLGVLGKRLIKSLK